jgi:O-acetylserine/cysteine efflux transporter
VQPRDVMVAGLVAAVWGFNFVVIAVGVDEFPPLLFAVLRFVAAALPAVFFVGRPCVAWRWILLIGLTLAAGQYGLLFTAIHLGLPAGLASVLLQSQAAFTMALAVAVLGERVYLRQVVGLLVAFGGMALIAVDLGAGGSLLAFALCIGAAACWSVGNIGIRQARPANMLNLMVWISVVPPVPLLGLSLLLEGPRDAWTALRGIDAAGLGAIVYIAYLSTLVAFGLWAWLIGRYGAATVAPYSLLVPVLGLSSAAIVLDEPLTLPRIVAALLVVGGIGVASVRFRRGPRRPASAPPYVIQADRASSGEVART